MKSTDTPIAPVTVPARPAGGSWLKVLQPRAPDWQFWGYETGNLIAANGGAGGLAVFVGGVLEASAAKGQGSALVLLTEYPDVAVTIGLAFLIATVGLLRLIMGKASGRRAQLVDGAAAMAGLMLIVVAVSQGVAWLTASALLFVSGSALLRLCREWPVFLKIGGLCCPAEGSV